MVPVNNLVVGWMGKEVIELSEERKVEGKPISKMVGEATPVTLPDTKKQKGYLSGRSIEPINLWKDMKVEDLVNTYAGMGFNARRLAEACELFVKMIDEDVTICMTVAGAMTPIGMSGLFIKGIEYGFIDWIVTTGANLYHDTHRAFGFPMVQGHFRVDDDDLHENRIARIYDVFIDDDDTLISTDKCIINAFRMRESLAPPFSTADVYNRIGKEMKKAAPNPEKSFMIKAFEEAVPIYVPSQADSSIGMNLIINYMDNDPVDPSPSLDILESAGIVRYSDKNGAVELGGGVPKNFFLQTQPTLWQILYDNKGGHDYFIQITDARPDTGGLSGATPSEAKSWGKVKDAKTNNVVVYCDSSIAAPLLMAYALSVRGPRKKKRLMEKKDDYVKGIVETYRKRFKERDDNLLDKYKAK